MPAKHWASRGCLSSSCRARSAARRSETRPPTGGAKAEAPSGRPGPSALAARGKDPGPRLLEYATRHTQVEAPETGADLDDGRPRSARRDSGRPGEIAHDVRRQEHTREHRIGAPAQRRSGPVTEARTATRWPSAASPAGATPSCSAAEAAAAAATTLRAAASAWRKSAERDSCGGAAPLSRRRAPPSAAGWLAAWARGSVARRAGGRPGF